MEIYLIRHTTPDIEKGICYGQTDLDLDYSTFEVELANICTKLPQEISIFYSSPLKRCKFLAEKLNAKFYTDDRLQEMNFGNWEYLPWENIPNEELNPWMNDFVHQKATNGESYIQLYERSISFLNDISSINHHKIGIVSHAGNIRSIISYVLNLPLEHSFIIKIPYGTVVHLEINTDHNLNKLISIH